MSRRSDRGDGPEVDLSKLPPPPAWHGGNSAEAYDWAEGDDPALDDVAPIEAVDATVEFPGATRVDDMLDTRGATQPATVWGWLRWSTGPRDSPRPGGALLPGRHVVAATRHLARSAHSWAYDLDQHPDAWRLTQLRPTYAQNAARYDEWEGRIQASMADRPKNLLIGSFALAVFVILLSVVLFFTGSFYLLAGLWFLIWLTLHGTGRSVAKKRGATPDATLDTRVDATLDTDATPRVPGRGEIQEAFRYAGAIGKDEELTCEPVREMRGNGWATTVHLPATRKAADAVKVLSDVASAFDTVDQLVTMVPSPQSNRRLWVWVAERDPLTGMAPTSPLITMKGLVNAWNGIPFGYTIRGERVRVAAVGTHWLTVGASGSGKSRAFGLVPLGYALDPYTQPILLDPEGFGAWKPYAAVAEVIEGSTVEDLRRMAGKLLWIVMVEMPRRQQVIEHILNTEPKLLPNNEIDAKISRTKRYRVPAMFIGIEEAVTLYRGPAASAPFDPTSDSKETIGQVAEKCVSEIQRRGRKYAIGVGQVSQKATLQELPSSVTFGATTRFMLGCTTDTQADSVMPGWRDMGMAPRKLKQAKPNRPGSGNPGAGYLRGVGLIEPDEDWVLLRSDYADGNEIADRMAYARARREEVWPELLPDFGGPDEGGPGASPPPPEDPPPAPDDPQRLEEVEEVFAPDEDQLLSTTIIGRLQARYPDDEVYRGLTARSMNAFLRPFGIRTTSVREAERKGKGLLRSAVIQARNACPDEVADVAPQPADDPSGAAAGRAETVSDQGRPDAPQSGGIPALPSDRAESAEGEGLGQDRGGRSHHLGYLPLTVTNGGFS